MSSELLRIFVFKKKKKIQVNSYLLCLTKIIETQTHSSLYQSLEKHLQPLKNWKYMYFPNYDNWYFYFYFFKKDFWYLMHIDSNGPIKTKISRSIWTILSLTRRVLVCAYRRCIFYITVILLILRNGILVFNINKPI